MNRGEIWWAVMPQPAGRRPVVLVSRQSSYAVRSAATVVEVSTRVRNIPTEVSLGKHLGLPKVCVANTDNLVTIPKAWLQEKIGTLDSRKRTELDLALQFALGLR
jgi:mRNA interferase MazF